jgi:hypothetical protein
MWEVEDKQKDKPNQLHETQPFRCSTNVGVNKIQEITTFLSVDLYELRNVYTVLE